MKVSVKKISLNENTYGTKLEDICFMPNPPKVGQSLLLLTDKLKGGIRTSTVTKINRINNIIIVKTLNSLYEIKTEE